MVNLWREFVDTCTEFKEIILLNIRYPCFLDSLEAGLEGAVVTYVVTKYALKRPERVPKYCAGSFLLVPMIYWPICMNHTIKQRMVERYIKERSNTIVLEELPPPSEVDKA